MFFAKLLVTLCFLGPTLPAHANDTPPLLMKVASFQKWSKLPSDVEGLLVLDEVQGIAQINYLREVSKINKSIPGIYTFDYEADSPVIVYFPSQRGGIHYIKNFTADGKIHKDVALLGSQNTNSYGIEGAAQFVKLEVNDGNGSQGQLHFIVTDAQVLHTDFLESPGDLLNEFLAPYSNPESFESKAVASKLDSVLAKAKETDIDFAKVKNEDGLTPEERSGFVAHWIQNKNSLQFAFYTNRIFTSKTSTRYGSEYLTTVEFSEVGLTSQNEEFDVFILDPEKKPERK